MDDIAQIPAFKRCRRTNSTVEANIVLANFLITAASTQGGRRYMEDRLQIEVGRKADGQLDFVYAAVYDGHGGVQASEYVRQHLFNNIVQNPSFSSEDDHSVLEAIREGFLQTHSDMRREVKDWPPTISGFPCTAGTTATCAFVRNGKLYTGHVGDSTIVLANFAETDAGYKDAKLTDDHKPDLTTERQRIERAGGTVAMKSGIFRVVWKRPMRGHRGPVRRSTTTENIPFLAVARSLGDFWSLNPISDEYIVSPEPDVDVFELKGTDNFIVVATDGLTTVVGIRAIIEVLRETERRSQHTINNNNDDGPLADGNAEQLVDVGEIDTDLPLNHAHCLLQYTFKRWSTLRADNVSIICIKLNANKSPTGRSVIVDDQSLNVSDALTDHPMATLRITDNGTQLLRTNAVRHRYFGTLDKCVKFSAPQNRISSATTVDTTNSALRVLCCKDGADGGGPANDGRQSQMHQQNFEQAEKYLFKGPGFVHPEHVVDVENNRKHIDEQADNTNSLDSRHDGGASDIGLVAKVVDVVTTTTTTTTTAVVACESDVEEVKEPSEVELALSGMSSPSSPSGGNEPSRRLLLHLAANENGCRPKSRTLQNLDSVKALMTAQNGISDTAVKWKAKSSKWKEAKAPLVMPSSPTATPRQSLKRRLRDDDEEEDGGSVSSSNTYGRRYYSQQQHTRVRFGDDAFAECASTTTTTSSRVSLEGDDCYGFGGATVPPPTTATTMATKPPPAKRSRIQSVVNFFTSLFGFRTF